jgi:hypothetical protein
MATLLKVLNNLADIKSARVFHFASELRGSEGICFVESFADLEAVHASYCRFATAVVYFLSLFAFIIWPPSSKTPSRVRPSTDRKSMRGQCCAV